MALVGRQTGVDNKTAGGVRWAMIVSLSPIAVVAVDDIGQLAARRRAGVEYMVVAKWEPP